MSRLKIAYVLGHDPFDRTIWSESGSYLGKALDKYIGDVHVLRPFMRPAWLQWWLRSMGRINRAIFSTEYLPGCSLILSWYAARQLERRLGAGQYDCIFLAADFTPVSMMRMKANLPLVYISDLAFPLLSGYFALFQKVSFMSRWKYQYLEKKTLKKSALLLPTTSWAARSFERHYGIDGRKVRALPLGANLADAPGMNQVNAKFNNPQLTLLFIGKDWEGGGGAIVLETFLLLSESQPDTRLIVCGCIPPDAVLPPRMEVVPYLDPLDPLAAVRRMRLMVSAHFLIQPTRADSYLTVAAEANAYGIPVITTETGGVPDIVQDGVNGYCLPYNADGRMYSFLIAELFMDKKHYSELVDSSRSRYEERLNWGSWAEDVAEVLSTIVQK